MTFKKGIIAKGLDEYKWFTKEGRVQLTFLENHDMNRFASEESDPAKQRLAAAIMACAKGAPIIYYGQELGMKGEQGHFGSDGNDVPVRLAYRWSRNLEAKGTALWYKNTGPWWSTRFSRDHDGVSLEEQQGDPNSLFNWYRKVIRLRRQTPVLLSGSQEVVDLVSETVLAFRRTLGKQSVLVLANMSERPCRLPTAPISSATDLITGSHITAPSVCRFRPWQVKVLEAQER
jgi:glycosidase